MNESQFILAIFNRKLSEEEIKNLDIGDDVNSEDLRITESNVYESEEDLNASLLDNDEFKTLDGTLLTTHKINELGHIL